MVTTFYPPYHFGGDAIFVHRLANELARRGHRVDVIHCRDAYRSLARREPERSYDDHPNVTVHGLKSRFGFLSPLASQQTGFPLFKSAELRRLLARSYDVIHYHNISLLGPKALEYGSAIKLYTAHEYWLICPTHTLFKFNRWPCERPHCFLCTLSYSRPPQWWRFSSLLPAMLQNLDALIVASEFTRNKHRQMGITVPIEHLPPFVPLGENGLNSPSYCNDSHRYFLFAGRLETLKGAETLIPLFRSYSNAQLWIAGTGNAEETLRRSAAGSSNIRFLGFRSASELRQFYRGAIALIVPSLCFETFGQVVIEAFSEHTPVIARRLGALPEAIQKSGGGILYDNDEELSAALDKLSGDRGYRDELGRLGYDCLLQEWTADVHIERYLALIRRIAEERQKRPDRDHIAKGRRASRARLTEHSDTPAKDSSLSTK